MDTIITWLKTNPASIISLTTALISASVAIIILVSSQWILSKRSRREFLTSKLEELYLLINDIGERNVERWELIVKVANREIEFDDTHAETTTRVYGLDINKKIVMLIRLYFPDLAPTHQEFFASNREVNKLLFTLNSGEEIEEEKIKEKFEYYLYLLRLFEEEIIHNKQLLIKANVLPKKYKQIA